MDRHNSQLGSNEQLQNQNQESITLSTHQVSLKIPKRKEYKDGQTKITKSKRCKFSTREWTITVIMLLVFVVILAVYIVNRNLVYTSYESKGEKNSLVYHKKNAGKIRRFGNSSEDLKEISVKQKQRQAFGISTLKKLNSYPPRIPQSDQQQPFWKYFGEAYEYDVQGPFNLWDMNSTYKKQLFMKYKALPQDKKSPKSKYYIDINWGKDQQFLDFAKNHQSSIEVINWPAIRLNPRDVKWMSNDYRLALQKRSTNLIRLLKKYKEQYEGRQGVMDPKKNITYKRFLQSLEYERLTGQDFKTNTQLKKIYQREKQYYRKTYHTHKPKQQIHACIVAPTYNNVVDHRYLWHLESILQQDYQNYRLIIIDDASTDQTAVRIAYYLKWRNADPKKIILIQNKKHMTAMRNIYYAMHKYCDYNQIFYILDGDDEIVGTQVFKLYNALYQQTKYYMIYSSHFQYQSKNQTHPLLLGLPFAYPESVKKNAGYRTYDHAYSQLRTIMTDLFLLLNTQSLKDENGQFYWTISDNALYFSGMELSCGRVDYIPQLQYWYNADTSINDWRTTQQKRYRRVKRHINYEQRHYQCIHKTIRRMKEIVERNYKN